MRMRITTLALTAVALTAACAVEDASEANLEARNEAIVLAMMEAVNARDLDALDTLVAPDVRRHSAATPDVVVDETQRQLSSIVTGYLETVIDPEGELDTNLLGMVLGRERRTLHDVAAGTVVVYDWGARQAEQPVTIREQLSARARRRRTTSSAIAGGSTRTPRAASSSRASSPAATSMATAIDLPTST